MTARGIVFFASGERYITEAVRAMRRSMKFNNVSHFLFCSEKPADADMPYQLFDRTTNVWVDRINCFLLSPFEQSLFLDVDCQVLSPVLEIFDLLDVYDLAAAHAPGYRGLLDPDVPQSFFELNCGVIACRKSQKINDMLLNWRELYKQWYFNPPFRRAGRLDQPSFRHVVWKLKIPVYVLGPEYNWRPAFPSFLVSPPKILHGYHDDPESIVAEAERRGLKALPPLIPHLTSLREGIGDPVA
jgi:hypothetical protein